MVFEYAQKFLIKISDMLKEEAKKMAFFDMFKKKDDSDIDMEEEYVELDTEVKDNEKTKIIVRPFQIEEFEDIKHVLDVIREGYTIALINIRPLKDKDLVELKRAINKLKKSCDAMDGDIAGFGEDWIAVVPSFAKIHREAKTPQQ